MSKLVDRLAEAKEHMRWELRRLEERMAELGDKRVGLEAYIAHLEKLLDKAKQASSNAVLEEVIKLGELKVQTKPTLFKMSKYLVEKEVEQKLEKARGELMEILQEIKATKQRKKDANRCPNCHGQGQLREVNYVREDGVVRPMLRITRCPVCEGGGKIDY